MKQFTMRVTTKMAMLLTYMETWGKVTVSAGEAASVMGVNRNQVASLCMTMLRHKYLVQQNYGLGVHYRLQEGLTIKRPSTDYLTVFRPADVDLMPIGHSAVMAQAKQPAVVESDLEDEVSEADGYLRGRHTWINAAGVPLPFTTAPRSVFELAGAMDHV